MDENAAGENDSSTNALSSSSDPYDDPMLPLHTETGTSRQMCSVLKEEHVSLDQQNGKRDEVQWEVELPSSPNSFTNVEVPFVGHDVFGDDATAMVLMECKKTVLKPYHVFLKIIGWRKFSQSAYDSRWQCYYQCVNLLWPTFLCVFLLVCCMTQMLICFSRDSVPTTHERNHTMCPNGSAHLLTLYIIPDIFLLSAFLYGLFIIRVVMPEHLSTFVETVFLGIVLREGRYSHKKLNRSLQLLLVIGLLWILYSMAVNILRLFTRHLAEEGTQMYWIPGAPWGVRLLLVIITVVGLVVFDLAYTAVVINYCIECQLVIYYVQSIRSRVIAKEWEFDIAVKEINNIMQFVSRMNSHLARAVSLMLFIFLSSSILSMYSLETISSRTDQLDLTAVTGFFSVIQWLVMLCLPLVQAARVTRVGYKLHKTAQEIRSRPYSYKDTPQLDLDSFLSYCMSTHISAKLVSVPISPAMVGFGFFILGIVLFLVFQFDKYSWATWL